MTKIRDFWKTLNTRRLFDAVVDVILKVMAPLMIVVLVIGVVDVIRDIWEYVFGAARGKTFGVLLTSILSIFVVIELLRAILEYFEAHRLKITLVAEAALVFLLREVMIGVYQQKFEAADLLALALLILVIGALRTSAVVFSPGKERGGKAAPG